MRGALIGAGGAQVRGGHRTLRIDAELVPHDARRKRLFEWLAAEEADSA